MKSRLLLVIAVLIFAASGCPTPDEFLDLAQCGTLIQTCDSTEHIIMAGVKDLSEEVKGDKRYYQFYDCATEVWIRSSCSADCSLEIR